MQIVLEAALALLIVFGLLGLGWLLFGKLVAPVGEEGRVFAVIPARGDAETLEHDVQGLLWLRGSDLAAFTVVIADYGLSDQGRILALLLQRRDIPYLSPIPKAPIAAKQHTESAQPSPAKELLDTLHAMLDEVDE